MQKRILCACLFTFIPLVSSAAFSPESFRPVVTLSAGPLNTNVYSSKSIMFGSYPNAYIGTNHHDTEVDLGFFVGAETEFLENWTWQIGAGYLQNKAFTERGNVYEFADPAFNNLTYQYQIRSQRVTIDTKISRIFYKVWHPYFSLSIGEAFNRAYAYTEYPITSADVAMLEPFNNHSTHSFTYSVGVGIDADISEHLRLGAGYRFADFGNSSLGMSSLQTSTNTISNTHLITNELLVQLSYVG